MAEVEVNHRSFSSHAASTLVVMLVIPLLLGGYFMANKSSGSVNARLHNKTKLTCWDVRNRFQQTNA